MTGFIKKNISLLIAFLLGLFIANVYSMIYAQIIQNPNIIYACIKQSGNSANVRIINANEACGNNETAIQWPAQGYAPGLEGVQFICGGCQLNNEVGNVFSGKNLSNAYFYAVNLSQVNFSNSILTSAIFRGQLSEVDFTNANLTNAKLVAELFGTNFTNANLTGASFSALTIEESASFFGNTNFTNANFTNANLKNAKDVEGVPPILTGAIWSNTTCPDGTNSDNNGNTCEGHFI